tara:strand:+ start:1496 stop:3373 length:1878 start_codon:yes stop_codon:yes gene_type:complete
MADVSSKLKVSELDFDQIKTNLKNFLGDQNEFADYDFDGSAMSVLLDLLSYNTHYNAFYLNMVVNEMFLDTASIRNSVVSRAKHLGYVPQSVRGAKAYVDLTITPADEPATIIIAKDTQFATSVNGTSYVFSTTGSTTINVNANGVYTAANVEFSQGVPLTHRYTANTQDPDQKFLLPNANTDTSTLTVRIQTSAQDTNTYTYAIANDTTTVNSTSNVYFLEESEDGKYEVLFGDDTIGRKPVSGNIILLSSLIADADAPNGAKSFTPVGSVGGYSNVVVSTLVNASGGSVRDDIQKIKFNAPRSYQAQNRAVTINDYIRILQRDYPAAESVVAWGGEENDPPVYGKVYIALKPATGLTLSTATKNFIKNTILANRNVVSVTPEVTDPDYLYVTVDTTIKYNSTNTTLTAGSIESLLTNTVYQYGVSELGLFADQFRYSPLIKKIDETESAIESSLTSVKLRRTFTPTLNVASSYTLKYSNKIPTVNGIPQITSTQFSHTDDNGTLRTACELQDANGVLQVFRTSGADRIIVANNVGTVSYASGNVALTTFKPTAIADGTSNVSITVALDSNDIKPLREQILLISNNDITITMIDTGGTGQTTAVTNTTSSTTATDTTSTSSSSY